MFSAWWSFVQGTHCIGVVGALVSMGFANETDMVQSLAATTQSPVPTCFQHGAGKTKNALMNV